MPRTQESLVYDTLQLEGGLFVPAVLEKAPRGEHEGQKPSDYQLPKGLSLLDEQGHAFRIATALWKNFSATRERTDIDSAEATAGFVGELLRDALGYGDLQALSFPEEIDGRGYPLSFFGRGRVPVVVAPTALISTPQLPRDRSRDDPPRGPLRRLLCALAAPLRLLRQSARRPR